jgi:hypothetical protein
MKQELSVLLATYAFYLAFEQGQYKASWRVHLFAIFVPILILKFVKDLDFKARMFIMTILIWHVIDVMTHAIDDGFKNDEDYQCTPIASTLKDDKIDEILLAKSLNEKDLMLNSSQPLMAESKPLQESISVPQNMGVQ